jgi:hypothetical protein
MSERIIFKENIEALVVREPMSGCWLWNRTYNKAGYGIAQGTLAHRIVYRWFKGDFDNKLDLMHLCHNTACVNPEHLQPGTRYENVMMSVRDGRWGNDKRSVALKRYIASKKDHHFFDPKRKKFSTEQVVGIRRLVDFGITKNMVAASLGVSTTLIRQICQRKVYAHVA